MAATAGTPRARALAAALREARISHEIGLRELARRIGISHTLVSQWEHGHRLPKTEDVATILTGIGVSAPERERVIELARSAGEKDWVTASISGISQQMARMLECERAASRIVDWSPLQIPGLLQTSDYTRAIMGAGGLSREQIEARVMVRAGRRDVLSRRPPTEFRALIGEPALRLRVGDNRVLAEQLRYLRKMTMDWDNVTVRVIRDDVAWHPGTAGPFVFYEFEESPPIVLLEHHRASAFLYSESDVTEYRRAVNTLEDEIALSVEDSSELLAEALAVMEVAP